jgi:hypothetical protein
MTACHRRLQVSCILLLVLFALGLSARPEPPKQFPSRIGQLALIKVITRQDAKDSLSAIHEQPVEVARAAIAYYEGEGEKAVVWWSRSATEAQAREQLERMVAKIRGGSYPYAHYRALERNGTAVHSFVGSGQVHYTYRRGDQLYWISAPAGLIDSVFDAVSK